MNAGSLVERQRELFRICNQFFLRMTGEEVHAFSKRGEFSDAIRADAQRLAANGPEAYRQFEEAYRDFYGRTKMAAFAEARALGGMKLVMGGSARFRSTQLNSVRKMLLYADTILLPDPISPWFEEDRTEEKFRHVILLETVYWLLHLKPLVDADLPYPAIVVFPSWERLLELNDSTTRERQQNLISETIGHQIGRRGESFDEQIDYATEHEAEFLEAVDKSQLFLAPGAEAPEPLTRGIERYREELRMWRSDDHVELLESLGTGRLVLNGLWERIGPQYHMLENAEELAAHPMMCLDAHWYYFERVTAALAGKLEHAGVIG